MLQVFPATAWLIGGPLNGETRRVSSPVLHLAERCDTPQPLSQEDYMKQKHEPVYFRRGTYGWSGEMIVGYCVFNWKGW